MLTCKSKALHTFLIASTLAFSTGAYAQVTSYYEYGILEGTFPAEYASVAPNDFSHNPFAALTIDDFGSYTEYTLSINNNLFSSFGLGAYLSLVQFDYNPNPAHPVSSLISSSVLGLQLLQTPASSYFGVVYDFGDAFRAGSGGNLDDSEYAKWRVDGVGSNFGSSLMHSLVQVKNITLPSGVNTAYSAKYTTLPVPEPETYALLLAGLGMLGLTARRRKSGKA